MISEIAAGVPAIIAVSREAGAESAKKPTQIKIGDIDCLVFANGSITPLVLAERLLDNPKRKRAKVELYDTKSFVDYVLRHKIAGRTHIFGKANELGGSFTAVLDYHDEQQPIPKEGEEAVGKAAPLAWWGEHTVSLTLETTPEWRRWIALNGKFVAQEQFAEHIEENALDIVEPAAADIIDMTQLLQGTKMVRFKSGRNLKNGSVQLEYVETIEANGNSTSRDDTLRIPDKFTLAIVPFVGAAGVKIDARLRFRIGNNGVVSWGYALNRPYKVIEDAFTVALDDIERDTKIRPLLGAGAITHV